MDELIRGEARKAKRMGVMRGDGDYESILAQGRGRSLVLPVVQCDCHETRANAAMSWSKSEDGHHGGAKHTDKEYRSTCLKKNYDQTCPLFVSNISLNRLLCGVVILDIFSNLSATTDVTLDFLGVNDLNFDQSYT